MDGQHLHQGELKRGLKNRHIQLIALGGAIGTGLFLGSAGVIKTAGPSMILGYAIGGFIAFLIMRQLGEMIVEEPVAGSFSHFAHKYWGGFAGFLSGWNYWVLYILVGMSELTAVGKYIQYWWPDVPTWATAAAFFVLINAINLANVKAFGETEFWFAIIKVAAIIGMILLGIYLLVGGGGGPQASVSNLWDRGGFFPNGLSGLVMTLAIIMFSFGGLELVGITAAEASEPRKVIPKAINQVIYRILIFYIGALAVLLSLYPWDQLVAVDPGLGADHLPLRDRQLRIAAQGAGTADVAGGGGAGDQLGDDQPVAPEVPRGDEAAGRGHLLQGTLVAVQQLPVPGLRGVHPWHHADDPRDQHLGVRHSILAAADVVVLPGQAVAGGKARARPAGLSLRVARDGSFGSRFSFRTGKFFCRFLLRVSRPGVRLGWLPGRWLFIIPELPCGAIHQSCQFSTLCAMMVIF